MLDWLAIKNKEVVEHFNRIKKQDENPFNNPNRACQLSVKICRFIRKSPKPTPTIRAPTEERNRQSMTARGTSTTIGLPKRNLKRRSKIIKEEEKNSKM